MCSALEQYCCSTQYILQPEWEWGYKPLKNSEGYFISAYYAYYSQRYRITEDSVRYSQSVTALKVAWTSAALQFVPRLLVTPEERRESLASGVSRSLGTIWRAAGVQATLKVTRPWSLESLAARTGRVFWALVSWPPVAVRLSAWERTFSSKSWPVFSTA